jgi:hypothetical protein
MEAEAKLDKQNTIHLFWAVADALGHSKKVSDKSLNEDDPAPALCAVIRKLPNKRLEKLLNSELPAYISTRLSQWWNEHQKLDAERERKEKEEKRIAALRKAALKKLTKAEREALGF